MVDEDFLEADKADYRESEDQQAAAKAELKRRCDVAGLRLEEENHPFAKGGKYLFVEFPAGREKRQHSLWGTEAIRSFLSIPFDKYVFLRPYEAICSYSDGTIEALLQTLEQMSLETVRRVMLGKGLFQVVKEDEDIDVTLSATVGTAAVALSPTSEVLEMLSHKAHRSSLSLKISGVSVRRHENAVDLLRRIADSLLFQIDTSLGLAFNLTREFTGPMRRTRHRTIASLDELQFPTQEYDDAPMSLFWYARSAHGMPLLQFLAYYQVIEFYFPTYYQAEARRKIRRILKDPTFRADRDADIGRVLSSLTSGRSTIGNECSMMRATMQECVNPDELRGFLTKSEAQREFFSSKTKGLASKKILIADTKADLRNDVADRVYEIRCKIVHTKSDSRDVELLLPFSKEADQLYPYIELVQYIAQQVLITASTPLKIG